MASLNFNSEKDNFRKYYEENHDIFNRSIDSFKSIIQSILSTNKIDTSNIIGRVKNCEESINKFTIKYQTKLESKNTEYEIKKYITDLIGLRIICLYEQDILKIKKILEKEFKVIDVTDKARIIEEKDDSFGYKCLHMDLRLKEPRFNMPEYKDYVGLGFEIQIRTIVQDSWSVLDHKIKYKKSIPTPLKRRINILAALFELADREFYAVREETIKLTKAEDTSSEILDVFAFLAISKNHFPEYDFHPYKIDGFIEELNGYNNLTQRELSDVIQKLIERVKKYDQYLCKSSCANYVLNPYTMIRHVLFLHDKEKYERILFNRQREEFNKWIKSSNTDS